MITAICLLIASHCLDDTSGLESGGGRWRGLEEKEKRKMREEGRKSDDRTISHPHGY